jgi:predicted NBD/HSP70 family sugar kinase
VAEPVPARRAHADGIIPEPDFDLMLDAVLAVDPAARGPFVERARTVGRATALLMGIFDPELVVVVEPGMMFVPDCLCALHAEVRDRLSVARP